MKDDVDSISTLALIGIAGYLAYKFLNPEERSANDPNCGLLQYYCKSNDRCLAWGDFSCPDGAANAGNSTAAAYPASTGEKSCWWPMYWCESENQCKLPLTTCEAVETEEISSSSEAPAHVTACAKTTHGCWQHPKNPADCNSPDYRIENYCYTEGSPNYGKCIAPEEKCEAENTAITCVKDSHGCWDFQNSSYGCTNNANYPTFRAEAWCAKKSACVPTSEYSYDACSIADKPETTCPTDKYSCVCDGKVECAPKDGTYSSCGDFCERRPANLNTNLATPIEGAGQLSSESRYNTWKWWAVGLLGSAGAIAAVVGGTALYRRFSRRRHYGPIDIEMGVAAATPLLGGAFTDYGGGTVDVASSSAASSTQPVLTPDEKATLENIAEDPMGVHVYDEDFSLYGPPRQYRSYGTMTVSQLPPDV